MRTRTVTCTGQTATSAPNNGSLTITNTTANEEPDTLVLRLQRPPARVTRTIRQAEGTMRVDWVEDTIDNEHMNKKKSKKCCIFKKKREFGESSDESDWEEEQKMKELGINLENSCSHGHSHSHNHNHSHSH